MTDAIVTTKPNTDLELYGRRSDVLELAERLKKMMPGGQRYNNEEALTLAQMSIAHNLDVFNGEAWLIKGNDGKVYGALVGIKGLRKHAKLQANYWGVNGDGGFTRVTDPAKLEEYGVAKGGICYEYRITDEVTIEGWSKAVGALRKAGLDLDTAIKMAGPMPFTLGIGVFEAGEKTKMSPVKCAMYRAEKDALKRRFDVTFHIPFAGAAIPEGVATTIEDLDAVDGEVIEPDVNGDEPVDRREEAEILGQLGFDIE